VVALGVVGGGGGVRFLVVSWALQWAHPVSSSHSFVNPRLCPELWCSEELAAVLGISTADNTEAGADADAGAASAPGDGGGGGDGAGSVKAAAAAPPAGFVGRALLFVAGHTLHATTEHGLACGKWFEIQADFETRLVRSFELFEGARRGFVKEVWTSDSRCVVAVFVVCCCLFCVVVVWVWLSRLAYFGCEVVWMTIPLLSVCSLLFPLRFSLHHIPREAPGSTPLQLYSAGEVLGDSGAAADPRDVLSMEILRRPDGSTGDRNTERLIPSDRLHGRLPDALLEVYQFWQASPTLLRGYPRKDAQGAEDTWLDVRLTPIDAVARAAATARTPKSQQQQQQQQQQQRTATGAGGLAAGQWGAVVWRRNAKLRAALGAHGGRVPLGPGDQLLLNLVPARPGTMLWRLRRWAGRLDNLSHVLVWSNSRGKPGDECEISQVDFPRYALLLLAACCLLLLLPKLLRCLVVVLLCCCVVVLLCALAGLLRVVHVPCHLTACRDPRRSFLFLFLSFVIFFLLFFFLLSFSLCFVFLVQSQSQLRSKDAWRGDAHAQPRPCWMVRHGHALRGARTAVTWPPAGHRASQRSRPHHGHGAQLRSEASASEEQALQLPFAAAAVGDVAAAHRQPVLYVRWLCCTSFVTR